MENQSGHPQHAMDNQGFPPFTLSATTIAQLHSSSSVNAASTMVPVTAPVQMPVLPSHLESGSICPADDGYIWKNLGVREIPDSSRLICYKCAQANCMVRKSVALSADGQVIETVFRGSHNHPRPSGMWPRDALAGYGSGSQGCVLPEVYAAGPSMPSAGEGGDHLLGSSDSEEDNEAEPRADGDIRGNANDTERGALVLVQRSTGQMASETLDGGWQQDTNSHQCKRRRSKSSKVWDEFTPVLSGGEQGAECNHCKRCLSGKSKGGTSHLRRHLKICPARPATGRVQERRSSPHPDPSVERNSMFDQDRSLELLTKALVSNFCSFSIISNVNFRQFLAGISPTYDVVSPPAIREKFLSIFQNEKLKLMDEIALAPGGVFLAVTGWRLECKEFICVTVHFIDKEWKMNRKIIRCSYLRDESYDTPYDASYWQSYYKRYSEGAIGIMKKVVQDWSLEQKLLGIALYRSLGDADIIDLQENLTGQNYLLAKYKLLTLPCIVDALNDFFYYSCPNNFVVEISRDWFMYMTCSPLRRGEYKEILSKLHNRPSFGSQKWHWTYCLLEVALQFNKAFPNPERMDFLSYPSKPSYEILQAAEIFCNLVRPIYNAIKMFYSPGNAALNSHFHTIWSLKIALMGSSGKENIDKFFKIEEMQKKFDKLWRKWYMWLSLAVVIDPRYKIRFIDFCFKQAFGTDAKMYILEVRGKMYELFLQYTCHADQHSNVQLNQRNNDLQSDANGSLPVHDASQNYIEQSAHEEFGELTGYLEGDLIPQTVNFDILKWWKDNASMYPTLARLARDILAIPGSAVSAESAAFDETDEWVSLFNQKMSHEIIEALICSQDWIKSSEINGAVGGN